MHMAEKGLEQVYKIGVYEVYKDRHDKFHIYDEFSDNPIVVGLSNQSDATNIADKMFIDYEMEGYRLRHPDEFGGR